jgi:hypothetical protein
MSGSPVVVVPALAEIPDGALSDVYVFTNGVSPDDAPQGPMGYQVDVFTNAPGDPGYSPLRVVNQVRWNDDAQPRLLRSSAEVSKAAEAGEITIERPGVVINMPFVEWPGGCGSAPPSDRTSEDHEHTGAEIRGLTCGNAGWARRGSCYYTDDPAGVGFSGCRRG